MNQPGNREITVADMKPGELPHALPLEGWGSMTLHCQVDAIGPSDLYPDLVKLEVSFPPSGGAGASCPTCRRATPEQHPRCPGVLRCSNCKEHLGTARLVDGAVR